MGVLNYQVHELSEQIRKTETKII